MSTPDPRDPVSPDAPKTTKQKRAKGTPLTSYGDLLHAAYGPVRRRWKPNSKEIREMQVGPKLDSPERAELLDLATSDMTLKRTRELMLFGMKRLDGSHSDRPIHGFVRDVLRRHPVYQSKSLKAALEHPDAPPERHTVHVLVAETRLWCKRSKLTKRNVNSCLVNALHCLLLWCAENRSTLPRVDDVLRYLQDELWTPPFTQRKTSEFEKLHALIGDRDPRATSVACSVLAKQVIELRQRIDTSRANARELQASLERTKEQLQETDDQLKDATERNARLDHVLGVARDRHANEKAHLQDDREKLRSSVVRRLKAELSLLEDGLHALRRDPPKVSVMDDHAERAIAGLTRELERLQD